MRETSTADRISGLWERSSRETALPVRQQGEALRRVDVQPTQPMHETERVASAAHDDGVHLSEEALDALHQDDQAHSHTDASAFHDAQEQEAGLPRFGEVAATQAAPASSGDNRRRTAVQTAIATGQPVSFTNASGTRFDLTVNGPQSGGDGFEAYTFAVNGQEVSVRVEGGVDARTAIAGAVNYWSQYPEALRGDLHLMQFNAGADPSYNPADPKSFKAKAAGGNNMIVFYEGTKHLNKKNFDHEMGHVIGDATEDRQASADEIAEEQRLGHEIDPYDEQWVPEGWSDAISNDKRSVSRYGNTSPTEDFAEFWKAFMTAQSSRSEMNRLQRRYPERFRIAASVFLGWEYRATAA